MPSWANTNDDDLVPMHPVQRHTITSFPVAYHLVAVIFLALASILSYLPISVAELLDWDTRTYINENSAIHKIDGSSLWWMLTQTYHANWHPLTWFSHALDIQAFGFAPFGHHWVNLAWHVGCASLWYFYCQLLLPLLLPGRFDHRSSDLLLVSFFAGLLFALHPQHVESVAWVAERKDLLCGFFYLLCLYCYHHYVTRPVWSKYLLTLGCATAAIMAKPMAVTLPAVLLVFDWLLYERVQVIFWHSRNWRMIALEKAPIVLLALISVLLTLQGQSSSGAISDVDAVSILQRLTTSTINWIEYLVATIVPFRLSPYYPAEWTISWTKFLFCLFGMVGLLLVAEYYRRRKANWIMLMLSYYTVTLLPVIGLIQIGTIRAADRYTYLPTLPLYLLAAVLIFHGLKVNMQGSQSPKRAVLPILLMLVIPLSLGFSTHRYSKVWQNDVTLWEYAHERSSHDVHATIYLAEAYYHDQRYQKALPLYRVAYNKRQQISPSRRLNIFINRYLDTAFQVGLYQEAELALNTAMQENRLWYLRREDIYFNAANINLRLKKFDTALQLIDMALDADRGQEKFKLLRYQILKLKEKSIVQ